jgi:hypothetical protein
MRHGRTTVTSDPNKLSYWSLALSCEDCIFELGNDYGAIIKVMYEPSKVRDPEVHGKKAWDMLSLSEDKKYVMSTNGSALVPVVAAKEFALAILALEENAARWEKSREK